MATLLILVNAVALLAVLVGRPAPTSVGVVELTIGACGGLAFLCGGLLLARRLKQPLDRYQRVALLCVILFTLPVVVSLVVGAAHGFPWESMFRSTLPYLALAGFGFAAPAGGEKHVKRLALLLAAVGVLHGLYLLFLFVGVLVLGADATSIRFARITLLDPRTTMPLVLAGAILPWTMLSGASGWGARLLIVVAAGTAVLGAAATLTRSMILAAFLGVGGVVFLLRVHSVARLVPLAVAIRRGAILVGVLAAVAAGVVAITPPLRALTVAVITRAQTVGDGGRIDDEWSPAMAMLGGGGVPAVMLGVGSGQTFVTGEGEARTYVHNLVVYSLLYSGVPGAAMWLLGYLVLTAELFRRGWREARPELLGGSVMVAAMFVYGQFFAVHKLFSYNLMLMLAIQMLFATGERRREGPAVGREGARRIES